MNLPSSGNSRPGDALPADDDARALFAKISLRVLPVLGLVWFIALVDRANLSFARIDGPFMATFGFSDSQFGFINGIFYLGYCVFAIPSNLILERVGAKRWIACLLGAWGGMTMLIALANGFASFWSLRLLLGVAEAGSYPAILLCLTYWFPPSRRALALSLFSLSQPAAGVVGSLAAGWLLVHWHGLGGLPGWQWLFLIEGGVAVGLVFVVLVCLPDRPSSARWLSAAQKSLHAASLLAESGPLKTSDSFLSVLRRPVLWLLVLAYFAYIFCIYGLGAWLPKYVKEIEFFRSFDAFHIGMLVAVPAVLAAPFAIWWARRSDRCRERFWHAALPAFFCAGTAAVTAGAAVAQASAWWVLGGLLATTVGMTACAAPFWSIVGLFLPERAAAPGIALVNSLGCLGGFLGPFLLGYMKDLARGRPVVADSDALGSALGMGLVAASFLVFAALCAFILPRISRS